MLLLTIYPLGRALRGVALRTYQSDLPTIPPTNFSSIFRTLSGGLRDAPKGLSYQMAILGRYSVSRSSRIQVTNFLFF